MKNTDYTRSSKTTNKQKTTNLKLSKVSQKIRETVLDWEANPIADKKQTPLNKARMSFKTNRE